MEKIDSKIGLEVHYQLDVGKLFCNCPSILREENPDFIIKRKLKTSAGELGEIDETALYEFKKQKEFWYETYNDSNCLVELDEEPPHSINEKALDVVLQLCLLLNTQIVDQIQIMRKTVIDGSNTSGFQRTILIGRNGFIETSKGKVKIATICLEEDAARKIQETPSYIIYRLDRLGIPLIEITTHPDIKTPEHGKEVAQLIGMYVKSTGKTRGGIGSIRQDLNISINNKPRIEIKGVQDLRTIPRIIENEIKRQSNLKEIKSEVRKVNIDLTTDYLRPMPGAARMYPETDIPSINITQEKINLIKLPELLTEKAIRLEKDFNLNSEISNLVIKEKLDIISLTKKFSNIEPSLIATTYLLTPKEIKKRFGINIKTKDIEETLSYYNDKKIPKDAIQKILIERTQNKKIDLNKYKTSSSELERDIRKIIQKHKDLTFQAYMGLIMKKYRGKANGQEIAEILKRYIKQI